MYFLVINTIKTVLISKLYSLIHFSILQSERINSSIHKIIRSNKVIDLPILTEIFDKKNGFHCKVINITDIFPHSAIGTIIYSVFKL